MRPHWSWMLGTGWARRLVPVVLVLVLGVVTAFAALSYREAITPGAPVPGSTSSTPDLADQVHPYADAVGSESGPVPGDAGVVLAPETSPAPHASKRPLVEADFGAFVPGYPASTPLLAEFEDTVGRRVDALHWFSAWTTRSGVFSSGPGDTTVGRLELATSTGRTPLLTWEPWEPGAGVDQPRYTLDSIANGEHDTYIRAWANGLREYGKVVYLRPMHEMNSDWYPWAGRVNGNGPGDYVAAWTHLRAIFVAAGATNVRFVWSVNNYDIPVSNRFEQYWPGSDQVDVIAVDGYNCYRPWTSFEDLFGDAYNRLVALDATKPMWITEVATCEASPEIPGSSGHSKAEWVAEMLTSTRFPRVSAVFWFDEAKSHDWRVDSSYASRDTFRSVFDQYGK